MNAISWEYVFRDTKGGTTLRISTDDKYFQFVASGKDFGIKHDPRMIVLRQSILTCYKDKEMQLVAAIVIGKNTLCIATVLDRLANRYYVLVAGPS
jgi:hypothetical protein